MSLKDGVQTIDLLLDVESELEDSGLIIPTPTPATLSEGDRTLFSTLEATIAPRPIYVDDWWGFGSIANGTTATGVRVLDSVAIGPVEATTLSASNTRGLNDWLTDNGYSLSSDTRKELPYYVSEGWSFVAVKLTSVSSSSLSGTIDPIRVTFETPELVYPMRLAAAATEAQSLRLYILDSQKMDVTKAVERTKDAGPLNAARTSVWAGPVSDPTLTRLGSYLTVIDLKFDIPETQIATDISIVESTSNADLIPTVQVVRPIAVLGVPLGSLIVVWSLAGLLLLFGALVARTRTR